MDEKEPTQRTDKGYEIPVPKRGAWDRLLRKAARPKPATDDKDADTEQSTEAEFWDKK